MLNIESRLEADADSLCRKFGVTVTDVFNAFLRNMVATGTLPPDIKREAVLNEAAQRFHNNITYLQEQSVLNGNSEMTMEEIETEIAVARSERRRNAENCH